MVEQVAYLAPVIFTTSLAAMGLALLAAAVLRTEIQVVLYGAVPVLVLALIGGCVLPLIDAGTGPGVQPVHAAGLGAERLPRITERRSALPAELDDRVSVVRRVDRLRDGVYRPGVGVVERGLEPGRTLTLRPAASDLAR